MSGELLDRRERKSFDVILLSEAQYENHDYKVTVNHFITHYQSTEMKATFSIFCLFSVYTKILMPPLSTNNFILY